MRVVVEGPRFNVARPSPLLCWLLLATPLLLDARAGAQPAPSVELERARAEVDRGEYQKAIAILEPKLYPVSRLRDAKELFLAHRLLGISYFYVSDHVDARKEFEWLLNEDPDFQLDPLVDSPDLVRFVDGIRGEMEERLERLRRVKALEAEERKKPTILYERVIEREYRARKPELNWVPFGVGQFKNGQRGWGTFFFISEATLGGVSSGIFLYQLLRYGPSLPLAKPSDHDELDTLRSLQVIQIGTGALFFVTYVGGVLHAYANTEDDPVEKTNVIELKPRRRSSRLHWVPLTAPGAYGVGAMWDF